MESDSYEGEIPIVTLRKKSEGSRARDRDVQLSVIDEEEYRKSLLVLESADAAIVTTLEARITAAPPSKLPVSTPKKGILKRSSVPETNNTPLTGGSRENSQELDELADFEALERSLSESDSGYHAELSLPRQSIDLDGDCSFPSSEQTDGTGLLNLERSIMEADKAVRQALNVSSDYTGYNNKDELDRSVDDHRQSLPTTIDKDTPQTNTQPYCANNSNNSAEMQRGTVRHSGPSAFRPMPVHQHEQYDRRCSEPANVHHHEDWRRSMPNRSASNRSTPSLPSPSSTPEYPPGYIWTSSAGLPLQSPGDSPRHRLSQSGSPISPASGHQTIVYVPIVTSCCKCCDGGTKQDPLRELVRHRRSSHRRDDDQLSMASSIDSEVARYLMDTRSDAGSNLDVVESHSVASLNREEKIHKALLVCANPPLEAGSFPPNSHFLYCL